MGADLQLHELFRQAGRKAHEIMGWLANDGIRWRFNPPAAPHFGGMWEAVQGHKAPYTVGQWRDETDL